MPFLFWMNRDFWSALGCKFEVVAIGVVVVVVGVKTRIKSWTNSDGTSAFSLQRARHRNRKCRCAETSRQTVRSNIESPHEWWQSLSMTMTMSLDDDDDNVSRDDNVSLDFLKFFNFHDAWRCWNSKISQKNKSRAVMTRRRSSRQSVCGRGGVASLRYEDKRR